MSLESNFTVNYDAKTVTHTSGTEVFTVLAFFQWLAAKFADTSQMDDDYAFVSDTPQVYRWVNGWNMGDETSYQYLKSGAITTSDGNKLFANLYSIGSQYRDSMIYIIQNDEEVAPWWTPGNIDILIKVKDTNPIGGGDVLVMSRDTDCLYDHNATNLLAGGRNPVGVNTFEDLNYKDTGDIYLDVNTVTGFDVGNFASGVSSGATGRMQYIDTPNTRLYLCQVSGTFTAGETIEESATRTGSKLDGTATNASTPEYDVIRGYSNIGITFTDADYDLNNGAGPRPYNVAINGDGRPVKEVYQYLKYRCAHNASGIIAGDAGEEYLSASGTYAESKQAPFGTFAGGTFFGARGVWVSNTLTAAYSLTDASGIVQNPPNYQKTSVVHDDLIGCNILVAERSGVNIIKNQYTVSSKTSDTITVTQSAIDINKTPLAGVVRNGDTKYTYTGFSGKVFTGVTPDCSSVTGDLYVPLLDVTADATTELSEDLIYDEAFTVKARVRKYGFKDFTLDTSFGAGGLAVTPVLADDPQAS